MTPEQKAAFINAQIALMNAEKEIMLSENYERERKGHAPAYGPEQWQAFYDKWEAILGYNAVTKFFIN